MSLYSRILPGPVDRHMLVLHGLFGSSDNWQTAGKLLSEKFTVHLLDMPNHGKSGRTDEMAYESMARAVAQYAGKAGPRRFHILGHSMGGKAVMRMAQLFPDLIEKLIVVDIGVKAYPPHHDFVFDAVNKIDLSMVTSRKEVEDAIGHEIADWTVQQFILKGLTRNTEGGYEWRTQFDILEKNIAHILGTIGAEVVDLPALFIAGEKSNYIKPEDHEGIQKLFPRAVFAGIDAGHWVHAEKPAELAGVVLEFTES